jgi:DNA-binding MarR family transcriptional regulator
MRGRLEGTPGPHAEPDGAAAARALARLEIAFIRHRRGVRRRLGVGDDELSVLRYLAYEGDVPLARLATTTTLSRSGLGALVQRLEERGLVERRTATDDRRLRRVRLSARGRERLSGAYHALDAAAGALLSGAAPADAARLEQLLDALAWEAEALAGAGDEPAAAEPPADPVWRSWG